MKTGLRILILTPTTFPAVTGNAMTVERWRGSLTRLGHTVKTLSSQNIDRHGLSYETISFRPQIIHAHHILKAGFLLLEKPVPEAVRNIPCVVSPAGTDIGEGQAPKKIPEIFLEVCRASGKIITQTPWIMKRIGELLPELEERIVYVPKALLWQGDEPANLREACGHRLEDFVFFLPAGIRPVKGNLECLKWLEKVHRKRPWIRAVFAGPALDDAYAARFEKEVFRLSAFARWIPRIPPAAMRSAYDSANVVLNASGSEGLSNTILEAIAAGRPVLASDIPGNRWPVLGNDKDKPCGCLFDLRNPEDFIRKAVNLVDDEGLQKELAAACIARTAGFPTPGDEASGLDQVYQSVIKRRVEEY
jgi:glycosyltransferase involved in cell wall biosynthesis